MDFYEVLENRADWERRKERGRITSALQIAARGYPNNEPVPIADLLWSVAEWVEELE